MPAVAIVGTFAVCGATSSIKRLTCLGGGKVARDLRFGYNRRMRLAGSRARFRAYAYGLVTTGIVLMFALAEWWSERYVADRSRVAGAAVEIAIVVLATLAFTPIHRRTEAAVEGAFTKKRREARAALTRLRNELTSFNDAAQLLRRVIEALNEHMGAACSAVYVRNGAYVPEASSYDCPVEHVEAADPLVVRLRSSGEPANPRALRSQAPGDLAFPMMASGTLVGFLVLTPGRIECEPEDCRSIATLVEAAGLALVALNPKLRAQECPRNNLPRMLTSFVGREAEIADLLALLEQHDLVTVVGPGGVGKTRATLQAVVPLLDRFDDGVWVVRLAPLSSGNDIPASIAHDMGLRLAPKDDPLEALVESLRDKHALIVVDNCEHLIEPAARVVAAILGECRKIKVLASSRQSLDITGECIYRLDPLGLPAQDDLEHISAADATQSPAIRLFAERAAVLDRRFTLNDENAPAVAEIARKLDGIPLAIELAASKTATLTPKQLSQQLDERLLLLSGTGSDLAPRQRTLRALIDWSFDLLDDEERAVLLRLAIFVGGWTLESASAVCAGNGIDRERMDDVLGALVSKSLVFVDPFGEERRYGMLFILRRYTRDRLEAAGDAGDIAAKHARFFMAFVESLAPLVESLEDVRWQHALTREIGNIRAALDWAIMQGNDVETGLRLLAQMEWPELVTTPQQAMRWFDAAKASASTADALTKARALRHHVRLEWLVGRPIDGREKAAIEALDAARASSNPDEIARALANVGSVHRDAGRFEEAEKLFAQAYQAPHALSTLSVNDVLRNWAIANLQHGDIDTARRRFSEVASRERPGSEAYASALLNLGELEFAANNVDAARSAAAKAREAFAQLNAAPLALAVCNQAAYAMAIDDLDEARNLLREALSLLKKSGARWMITALEHHATLGVLVHENERAAALLGFTNAHYVKTNDTRQRTEQFGYERAMRLLSDVYAEDELVRRLSAGAGLTADEALEHAAAISQHIRPPAATAAI